MQELQSNGSYVELWPKGYIYNKDSIYNIGDIKFTLAEDETGNFKECNGDYLDGNLYPQLKGLVETIPVAKYTALQDTFKDINSNFSFVGDVGIIENKIIASGKYRKGYIGVATGTNFQTMNSKQIDSNFISNRGLVMRVKNNAVCIRGVTSSPVQQFYFSSDLNTWKSFGSSELGDRYWRGNLSDFKVLNNNWVFILNRVYNSNACYRLFWSSSDVPTSLNYTDKWSSEKILSINYFDNKYFVVLYNYSTRQFYIDYFSSLDAIESDCQRISCPLTLSTNSSVELLGQLLKNEYGYYLVFNVVNGDDGYWISYTDDLINNPFSSKKIIAQASADRYGFNSIKEVNGTFLLNCSSGYVFGNKWDVQPIKNGVSWAYIFCNSDKVMTYNPNTIYELTAFSNGIKLPDIETDAAKAYVKVK